MAKKKDSGGGYNWMDTYGDLVTLLLTFFVMLYSMSSVEEDKWAALVRAFNTRGETKVDQIVLMSTDESGEELLQNDGDGIGDSTVDREKNEIFNSDEMNELYKSIKSFIDENNMAESIEVKQGDGVGKSENDGIDSANSSESSQMPNNDTKGEKERSKNIYIQFKNNVLFMPDKSSLREESYDIMGFLGDCLGNVQDDIALIIVKGHTAISPTSTVDSRLLSSERASTISNFLERNYDIPSTKLFPIGLAGDYPIATNENEAGRQKNRRVEIVIVGKNSDLAKSGELLKVLGASFDIGEADIDKLAE